MEKWLICKNTKKLSEEWHKEKVNETSGVEEERKLFREAVLMCTGVMCDMRKVGCVNSVRGGELIP